MIKVGEIIRYKKPQVYSRLMGMEKVAKKEIEITFEDANELMRHESYKRVSGAIKQIKYTS